MIRISTNTKQDVYVHIGIIISLLLLLFFGFFFVYLPASTQHGKTITVPNLKGMNIKELEDYLDERNLSYEISDCTYVPRAEALTVLMQFPKPDEKVKEGRKIYVTISTAIAPNIRMPKLTEMSLKSAEMRLQNYGLEMGSISYIADLRENTVIEQHWNGKKIETNALIPKGSKIDFVVGNGLGNTQMEVPNVVGNSYDEAKLIIEGSGLSIGTIIYDAASTEPTGTVIRQNPENGDGNTIQVGDSMDIWVSGEPPKTEPIPDAGQQ